MNAVVKRLLAGTKLGDGRVFGALTVLPMYGEMPLGPDYITLAEALASETLLVTEVDKGGSVPTLRAHNTGEHNVLILDGEELRGAKQNRVLNTAVLIAAGKTIDLPVSCTESGRWGYNSSSFSDSGHVAVHAVRRAAHRSVTASVRSGAAYRSDQGRVWAEVDELADRHGVSSPTSAMRDVFEKREREMSEFLRDSAAHEGQIGLMAVVSGKVAGFDLISRPQAYAQLHERLLHSYAFDARGVAGEAKAPADLRTAKEWLVDLADVTGTEHESPGMGRSHRFTGDKAVGAALTYRGAVVHAGFFASEDGDGAGRGPRMSHVSIRRTWASGGSADGTV